MLLHSRTLGCIWLMQGATGRHTRGQRWKSQNVELEEPSKGFVGTPKGKEASAGGLGLLD